MNERVCRKNWQLFALFFRRNFDPKINRLVLELFPSSSAAPSSSWLPFMPLKCAFECTIRQIPINRNRKPTKRTNKRTNEQRERKRINQVSLIVDNSSHTYRYLAAKRVYTHTHTLASCCFTQMRALQCMHTKPFNSKTLFLLVSSLHSFRSILYFFLRLNLFFYFLMVCLFRARVLRAVFEMTNVHPASFFMKSNLWFLQYRAFSECTRSHGRPWAQTHSQERPIERAIYCCCTAVLYAARYNLKHRFINRNCH